MPDELDHEVIDSPQALFRHLYEAHGVIEALDLDPDTAPLQFWLRRHSDLERAAARAAAEERRTARAAGEEGSAGAPPPLTGPEPGARLMDGSTEQPAPGPTSRPARGPADRAAGGSMAARGSTAQPAHGFTTAPRPGPATAPGTARSPSPQPQPGPAPDRSLRPGRLVWRNRSGGEQAPAEAPPPPAGSGSGPRFRPFTDPLVEAVAVALIGRGLDERRVRRGLSTFTGADRRHGEDAVRATFVVPMLDALAAHLAGNPQNRTQWPPSTWTPSRNAAEERQPRTPDRPGRERTAPDVAPESWARETAPPGTPPRTPTPPSSAPRDPAPAAPPRNPVPSSPAWREPAAAAPPPPAAAADSAVPQTSAESGKGSARDVAEESLIAQPLGAPGPGPAPDADFMAIADVLQERRRSRPGGRREAAAARASGPSAARASGATAARGAGAAPTGRPSTAATGTPATGRPSPAAAGAPATGRASGASPTGTAASGGSDDDVMALADAVQRRRASRRQPGRQSGSRARSQP